MKTKFLIGIAVFVIAALTLYSVQASKYNGEISSDDVALMAQDHIKSDYPMGCDYNWEGYFCRGNYCFPGGEPGVFCDGGGEDLKILQ